MSTQLATLAVPAVACDECGQDVLRIYTTEQRQVTLDAQPVSCGLYGIDQHNRARRHRLVELFAAERAERPLMGHDPHECHAVPWYAH